MIDKWLGPRRQHLERWRNVDKKEGDLLPHLRYSFLLTSNGKGNAMSDYAHPEVLVTTEWVAAHAKDHGLRVVEVDVDTTAYDQGHVDGAIAWNWQTGSFANSKRNASGTPLAIWSSPRS